jgi:hypothetical protein
MKRLAMLKGTCHCGATHWTLSEVPATVTACSCTICRRYGALWAYGHLADDVEVSGETTAYYRADGKELVFHFCTTCGSAMFNMAREPNSEGKRWIAVNCRMTEPELIAELPVDHFDGHDTWEDLPPDGRKVRDMWF